MSINDGIVQAFKAELAGLLRKYKAGIHCSFDGDTHGIYNEHMTVTFAQHEEVTLAEGFGFDSGDIGFRYACDSRGLKMRTYDCGVLISETVFEDEAGYRRAVEQLEQSGQNVYKY